MDFLIPKCVIDIIYKTYLFICFETFLMIILFSYNYFILKLLFNPSLSFRYRCALMSHRSLLPYHQATYAVRSVPWLFLPPRYPTTTQPHTHKRPKCSKTRQRSHAPFATRDTRVRRIYDTTLPRRMNRMHRHVNDVGSRLAGSRRFIRI